MDLGFSRNEGGMLSALGLLNVEITGGGGGEIIAGPEKSAKGSRSSSSVKLDSKLFSSESTSRSAPCFFNKTMSCSSTFTRSVL